MALPNYNREVTSLLFVACAALGLCPAAHAQALSFTRIADTTNTIPNGSGNFTGWGSPSLSGSTVAFCGFGTNQEGFYTGQVGGVSITKIADFNTPIPAGSGNFTTFFADTYTTVSGSTVLFRGQGSAQGSAAQVGFYTASTAGGPLTVVADTSNAIPGGTGNFAGMSVGTLSGSTVAFGGGSIGNSLRGVYTGSAAGGSLARVADTNTGIPNGVGNFTFVGVPSVSGSTVVFQGFGSGQRGIYIGSIAGGPLTRLADLNTPIPNGTGNFTVLQSPSLSGSTVAFMGAGSGQQGIYIGLTAGEPLTRVADLSTPIPNGTGNFTSLNGGGLPIVSVSGSTVAFLGSGSANQVGIYTGSTGGGPLTKVIAAGDILDGRTVNSLSFGPTGLDGNSLAFVSIFTNGTSGVYVAVLPVPEPGCVLGLSTVGLGVARLLRRAVRSRVPESTTPDR